jgi:hypothetical protein
VVCAGVELISSIWWSRRHVSHTVLRSLLVANSFGSALSSNAVLTVLPVVVATLPASGISSTGAVLNGSVALGPNQTLAWFEWGTDTNYGNIAGVTNIAASNATVVLSVPLNGLSTDYVYHYRLVAWNALGLVYGADQVFAVGLAPAVATLPTSANTAAGASLNGVVNPLGLDTVAYFRWGPSSFYYQYTTPPVTQGRGVSAQSFSAAITGLEVGELSFALRSVRSREAVPVFIIRWH